MLEQIDLSFPPPKPEFNLIFFSDSSLLYPGGKGYRLFLACSKLGAQSKAVHGQWGQWLNLAVPKG